MRTPHSLARRIAVLERQLPRGDRPLPLTLDALSRCLSAAQRIPADVAPERREVIQRECEELRRAFLEDTRPRSQRAFLDALPLEVLLTLADESDDADADSSDVG